MCKPFVATIISFCFIFSSYAQVDVANDKDTFFLARKKGLLGKLGRSISRNNFPNEEPVKVELPYQKYNGRVIHSIEVVPMGFDRNIYDTAYIRRNLGTRIANAFHKNSRESLIRKNIFFKEGEVFYSLQASDNERFLRDQTYIQDALIVVFESAADPQKVDVVVLTRDVFSIGVSAAASSTSRIRGELKEENLGGTGSRLAIFGLYDKEREPGYGVGIEFVKRAIRNHSSVFNWTNGVTTFSPARVNGRREENKIYTSLDKPFTTRYMRWTGNASMAYHMTSNAYSDDSVYQSDSRYRYVDADIWLGYNIAYRGKKRTDTEKRVRHLIAARSFYTHFGKVPAKYANEYNFNYANVNGVLMEYNIYRQNFYKTKFIYGFGRNEDVPVGFHGSITSGWTNKQNAKRWYYGMQFEGSTYSKKGFYSLYTFRLGGFKLPSNSFEDISMLLGVDHFTRLRWIGKNWLSRNFVNVSYSKQFNSLLNAPLSLQSEFGMPYLRNVVRPGDERTTVKLESVFFHIKKYSGFRVAPFVFSDFTFLRPEGESLKKTNGYSALGAGIRTRNENLIFGTIEFKSYYFPRVDPGLSSWRFELNTNVRFRYNSNFIRKPEFVLFN